MTTHLKNSQAASSPWEQATLLINGSIVHWGAELVLLRGQENIISVHAPAEIARELAVSLVESGGLEIDVSPEFQFWVPPVDGTFNWTLIPEDGESGRITLVFYSREVLVPWEHRSLVISENLADEVDQVLVGGAPSPADGALFFRNEPQTVTLTYKQGSPLQGYPLKLTGAPLTGVQPGNLVVTAFDNNVWSVNSHTNSGTFKLELTGENMNGGVTLPACKVMSRRLADEINVKFSGREILPVGLVFIRDTLQKLTITAKPDSPFDELVSLEWVKGAGLIIDDIKVVPNFGVPASSGVWDIRGSAEKEGDFSLKLSCKTLLEPLELSQCAIVNYKYLRNSAPITLTSGEGSMIVTYAYNDKLTLVKPAHLDGFKVSISMSGAQLLKGPSGTIVHDKDLEWSTNREVGQQQTQVLTFTYELLPGYSEKITVRSIHPTE